MMSNNSIINSSAYHFMTLQASDLPDLQTKLQAGAAQSNLKGTILLSLEGINLALAGTPSDMDQFKLDLCHYLPELKALSYRETYSATQPFKRLFVKIKKQIIPFPDSTIPLEKGTAPYIEPNVLLAWLQEEKDIILLDARNQYEVEAGTFQKTTSLSLNHFRDFPALAKTLPTDFKQKPMVTFCTGGIRCEKASSELLQQGFKEVYQLKGGILNYFDQCGGQYYQGGCFVFDEREVVYPNKMPS